MAMLKPIDRFQIGCAMLSAGRGFRSAIAAKHQITRRYAYTLMHNVERIIEQYRDESITDVLPLTDLSMDRAILSLAMDCHASLEGIQDALLNQYNYSVSISTISRKLSHYGQKARQFLEAVDLSGIVTCAYDEVFQCGDLPILGAICLDTHYIAELVCTPDRTAESWAITMSLLHYNQNLDFLFGVSDFGSGILAGIPMVFPNAVMQGDVFHALMELGEEIQKIENLAIKRLTSVADMQATANPQKKTRERLAAELVTLDSYLIRADIANQLMTWLKEQLAFPGYYVHETKQNILWILDEMDKIDGNVYKLHAKTATFRKRLDSILAYHTQLYSNLSSLSRKENVSPTITSLLFRQSAEVKGSTVYKAIQRRLSRFDASDVEKAGNLIKGIIGMTHRASSMIECTNSRLRKYINAKHFLSNDFLALVRLYFNTKKLHRAEEKRMNASSLELLTGDKRDFFEILGIPNVA